jgi:chromosome segregation ATPase
MYTQKKPIENAHIVRERDRRRFRELLAVFALGVPIGLFLLLFTWQNLEVIRLGREATRLQKSLKDTEAAHKSLEAELDRLTSFETVNEHFKRLFTELFGGGEAALHLIESDDPLEAGLEIIAKPPGKKPQTLSLLSGGEQALTALAMIFAVFLTNPSPICVLDEVDAPLDDHNVERFCTLLHEMTAATDTRFIIITHNPITMARMNRLFGVTMAERGVSQLVSVGLDDAVKILDQNVA